MKELFTITNILIALGVILKVAGFIIWRKLAPGTKLEIIDRLKRAFGFFDSRGLRFSKTHLQRIDNQIIFWDIAKQADYRDRVCEVSVLHEMEHTFLDIHSRPHFPGFNATSVGNLAFVALYSLNPKYKAWALSVLTQYRVWKQR